MMTTIYGLREAGSDEIRYVGRTDRALSARLHKHKLNAKRNYPPRISAWINRAGDVEIFALRQCSRDDACLQERRLVERLHAAGHRLTNSHLVRPTPASGGLSA